MSEPKGHAAFHKHPDAPRHDGTKEGTRRERRAILKESMRHLDARDVTRHAKANSNIVAEESHLNTAFVNNGVGGFEVATKVKQILDYGDAREKRVRRKVAAGSRTVDLFVVHLPKTMCLEIEDFYPRHNPDGTERFDPDTGEPMSRSRWVARDQEEAMRYFRDAVAFLGDEVSPGGRDSIHGWATNFDESTPHIQIMTDPFGADPKAPEAMPDALRIMASQAYTSHREVRKANGKMYGKGERLREYQAALREHMVSRGWPVERETGENHGKGLGLEDYKLVQDEKAEARALYETAGADLALADGLSRKNAQRSAELDGREAALSRREGALSAREQQVGSDQLAIAEQRRRLSREQEQLDADRKQQGRNERERSLELDCREDLIIAGEQRVADLDAAYLWGLAEMKRQGIKPTPAAINAKSSIRAARAKFRAARAEQLGDDVSKANRGMGE